MIFGCRRTTTVLLQSGLAGALTSALNTRTTASWAPARSGTSAAPPYPPDNNLLIFRQWSGSCKRHRAGACTLVIFCHVRLELSVDFVVSLLRGEFASSGEALAAIGASPCHGIAIDLFCNNQLRHGTIMSHFRCFACPIENGPQLLENGPNFPPPAAPRAMAYRDREMPESSESFLSGIGHTTYCIEHTLGVFYPAH